jgi:hypothetical protein
MAHKREDHDLGLRDVCERLQPLLLLKRNIRTIARMAQEGFPRLRL